MSAASTSDCSTGRCSSPSRAGPRQGRASTARRRSSCWRGSGSREPAEAYEVARPARRSGRRRMGKVLGHVFPVMVPALALASDPDAALVRLERVGDGVGGRPGRRRRARERPAARRAGSPTSWPPARSRPTCWRPGRTRIRALEDGAGEPDGRPGGARGGVAARWAARELTRGGRAGARGRGRPRRGRRRRRRGARGPVRGRRGGQARREGAERRLRSRPAVRLRGRGTRCLTARDRGRRARDGRGAGCRVGDGRGPSARGSERAARPFVRRLPRVLGALRRDLGVPIAHCARVGSPATRRRPPLRAPSRATSPTRPRS